MAVSNSTSLNDLVGEIVSSQVQKAAYAKRVLRNLVRVHHLPPGAGSLVVPQFDAVSVASLTEAVAPNTTQMTTDGKTLTPVERGVYVRVGKRVLHADPFSDLAPYSAELGAALAQDEDEQIIAQFDFTQAANTDSSAVDVDDFLKAISMLESANSYGNKYAIFHPNSWAKLRKELGDWASFANVGKQIVEGFGEGQTNNNGYVGSPFGVHCYISTAVPMKMSNDATPVPVAYRNSVFTSEAVAVGFIRDIGVDVDDNIPARALDLMAWYTIDAVKLKDNFGVTVWDDIPS